MPTISRLFRDCPATIPGTAGEPRGDSRAVPERARRSSGREVWRQAVPRICERGRECGRVISRRRGECLYLPRNCPLNARLRSRSIPIYPRYKRAVYARFRGYFATAQKTAPKKNAGALCGAVIYSAAGLDALHRAGDREKPRQASSLSGRLFTWSVSPRQ